MAWESTDVKLRRVLRASTLAALARREISLERLYIHWSGDAMLQLALPVGMHEDAIAALLSDPATAELGLLAFDDKTYPPLHLLARPKLATLRIESAYDRTVDVDASRYVAAMPQLTFLMLRARRAMLGAHAGLQHLNLALAEWPFHRDVRLPALKELVVSIVGAIDPGAFEVLRECAPALETIEIRDPIDPVLRCLRDVPPLPVKRILVTGNASIAIGRELVARPGYLADAPSVITVECQGKGRRWLDSFAGDPVSRAQKLATKGARWSQLFATCTEPPSPSIVFDDPIAFLPFSPRERALRDCGKDAAQVLVYADWLEEQGAIAMADKLRQANLAEPMLAIQRADDNDRDSFRQTVLVLLDAWRQLSPSAPIRESADAFRERIHAHLQNLTFRKLSKRDAASLATVEQLLSDELRTDIGRLLRVVQVFRGVVAAESTNGYLVAVTNGYTLLAT